MSAKTNFEVIHFIKDTTIIVLQLNIIILL